MQHRRDADVKVNHVMVDNYTCNDEELRRSCTKLSMQQIVGCSLHEVDGVWNFSGVCEVAQ